MSDLFLLSERRLARIEPYLPLAHGVPRVDNRRVVSGIVYVIKHGLQWKDAPKGYGSHKTLYNCFIRWSRLGVFDRIFATLAGQGPRPERMAHHTAASPVQLSYRAAADR
ncbi:transposase [Shinella fusca]|uniref:Transposase n=1 Tax=Shinella fusca TaxID=544480 RepID=A0A7W7YSN6_9HYPH|nr:transposase [Shinella fusca]